MRFRQRGCAQGDLSVITVLRAVKVNRLLGERDLAQFQRIALAQSHRCFQA
jgi:hypothetical protein